MGVEKFSWKPWIFLLLMIAVIVFYFTGGKEYLEFEAIRQKLSLLQSIYFKRPLLTFMIFFTAYVLLTALSVPGSLVLTLVAGTLFGTPLGATLVSMAGSLGALIAFSTARYLLKETVAEKYSRQFQVINRNLQSDGVLYLLSLRMIPVSPFVIINLVMGVTGLKWWTFFWTTLLGMLPGNLLYVFAGKRISEITSPSEIMTPALITALTLLGILPWLLRRLLRLHRRRQLGT